MSKSRLERAVPTALAALLTVVATYAVLRAYDVLFRSEPNPATLIATVNIAMFWRLGIGCYVAGAVATGVFFATERHATLVSRIVAAAVPIVAAMIALQGVFLP